MWKATKGLLSSKKAQMAFISALVWGVAKVGLDLPTEHVAGLVAPLWAYIFGQGISDLGKGKKQAELDAAAEATSE
jgi:hypothetical protein